MNLLPQQVLMRDFILAHPSAALFVDMGLGKTAATLAAVNHLLCDGACRGVLVVAPLRVATLTWPNEVEQWFPHLKVANLRTAKGRLAWQEGSAHIYLINYDLLQQFAEWVEPWPVDMVVWDELSKAKSHNSKRLRAFLPHRKKLVRHVGLTGTPLANGYLDLFAPIRLLDGGERLGKSYHAYCRRYFSSDYMGWTWEIKDWAKEVIQKQISDMVLTLRAEEYLHIPPTTVEDVGVILPNDVRRQYKKLEKDALLSLEDSTVVGINAAALVGKLLQFTSGAVYDENKNPIEFHRCKILHLERLDTEIKEPLIVATQFIHERNRILEVFPHAEPFKEDSLDRWNAGKIKMLVVDPRSVGHGLNLQAGGRHIIWFSLTYSRELYDQMNARLIRTGQDKETTIWRLMCPDTVDWAVAEALRNKGDEQDSLKSALKNLKKLHEQQ